MGRLRRYIYVDVEDFDGMAGERFLRIDIFVAWAALVHWLRSKRPRVLQAAENYVLAVDSFVARQKRIADIAAIRANPEPGINDMMKVMLFEYEHDILDRLGWSFFGKRRPRGHYVPDCSVFEGKRWVVDEPAPPSKVTGLKALTDEGYHWEQQSTSVIVHGLGDQYDPTFEEWHDMGGDA